jgi:hypothetical protein
MNPYVSIQGGTAVGTATAMYIDRVTQGEFTMSSKTLTVSKTALVNIIPDGAKILGMKVHNINGRKVAVTIPSNSGLLLTTGDPAVAPTAPIQKVAYAPFMVFPKLKVEIPDIAAASIDTAGGTGASLFTLTTDGASDTVVVRFHYKQAV